VALYERRRRTSIFPSFPYALAEDQAIRRVAKRTGGNTTAE
jgi:hypothetical protein